MGRLILVLSGYILVGAPLVLFTWHQISEALLGRIHTARLLTAIALVPLIFVVLSRLGHFLRGLEESERRSHSGASAALAARHESHLVPGGDHESRGA